ncbi:MAG: hotdog domain-containing protein [Sulfolobales archaeon]
MDVEDTYSEYIRIVFPRHANPAGFLYGGYMLHWIIDSSMASIIRTMGGEPVLGYIDNVYFINPVKIGSMLIYRSWLGHVGRSSLDVYTEIIGYSPVDKSFSIVASAKSIYVNIDSSGRPTPHGICIEGGSEWSRRLMEYMASWHERSLGIIRRAKEGRGEMKERVLRHQARTLRRVSTEDTMTSNIMYAGRLMLMLDEISSIVAHAYAESPVVTASVDQMIFTSPIKVGDILEITASLTRTWRTSMEIEVEVRSHIDRRDLKTRSYFTFVKIGEDGKPRELKPYTPLTPEEIEAWEEAEMRRKSRLEDLNRISKYKGLNIDFNRGAKQPYLI